MTVADYRWRKATVSGQEANCVEIGRDTRGVVSVVRDSKAPSAGMLTAGVAQLIVAARRGLTG